MRRFLCAALVVFAVPAFAQDAPEVEDDEFEIETDDGPYRFHVERDGPRVIFRHGDGERVFNLDMPEGVFEFDGEALDMNRYFGTDSDFGTRFRFLNDGPGNVFRVLGSGSMSAETRERMRALQAEARELAMRARTLSGTERADAERQLDTVLGELFDVRGQARQEEADALRERARELMAEADEKEAALRDRAARRQALIEARRAELMGTASSDW